MVYRRGKTYWISYVDARGRRVRESSGVWRKRDAEEILAAKRSDVARQVHLGVVPQVDPTFEELATLHWKHHASKLRYNGLEGMIRQWTAHFGTVPVSQIMTSDVEQYLAGLNRSVGTINRNITQLRAMFNWGNRFHVGGRVLTTNNPTRGLKKGREKSRLRYLDADEIPRLLAELQTKHNRHVYAIVLTALYTGMSRGELFTLTWEDIDFEADLIHVRKGVKGRQYRSIPIHDELRPCLAGLASRFKGGYLFTHPRSKGKVPLTTIKSAFPEALARAGIENFRFHDLRHHADSRIMPIRCGGSVGVRRTECSSLIFNSA